jgi:hypothetical protein
MQRSGIHESICVKECVAFVTKGTKGKIESQEKAILITLFVFPPSTEDEVELSEINI